MAEEQVTIICSEVHICGALCANRRRSLNANSLTACRTSHLKYFNKRSTCKTNK